MLEGTDGVQELTQLEFLAIKPEPENELE